MALCISLVLVIDASAQDKYRELNLEGKQFEGSIRATGILGLISVNGVIRFKDGLLVWTVDKSDDDYPPAVFKTERRRRVITFSSHMLGKDGDYVDWSGVYDGETLSEVKAVWTRVEGDFMHDLLLPKTVTLIFTQN